MRGLDKRGKMEWDRRGGTEKEGKERRGGKGGFPKSPPSKKS